MTGGDLGARGARVAGGAMTRGRVVVILTASLVALTALPLAGTGAASAVGSGSPATAPTAPGHGTWGWPIEVPRSAGVIGSGNAQFNSVSCPSAGNCTAGGYYTDSSSANQGLVASERNGRWSAAVDLPGLAALNTYGYAQVNSVSCSSAGNCAAGGYYTTGADYVEAFVASERNGHWSTAIEVPGTAALNVRRNAWVYSVSCPPTGNCTAGGYYTDNDFNIQAFVASQRNGRWGTVIAVPGLARLNSGGNAPVHSVSCPSAGNCTVAGEYADSASRFQAFVASERKGRWGTAIEVPGTAALNAGGVASINWVSCSSAGNCAAGGEYADRRARFQAFVASERNGRWGTAIKVPGTAQLNAGGNAQVFSVSCPQAGNCAAVGY